MIPIRDILARLESLGLLASTGPDIDLAVTGVTDDSREIRAGDLFIAVKGSTDDGQNVRPLITCPLNERGWLICNQSHATLSKRQ